MAQMNRRLTGVETILLPTDPQWAFVSSSLVREVADSGRRRVRVPAAGRGRADRRPGERPTG